jgi:hypothetical protein
VAAGTSAEAPSHKFTRFNDFMTLGALLRNFSRAITAHERKARNKKAVNSLKTDNPAKSPIQLS